MTTEITTKKSWQPWLLIVIILVLVGLAGINYNYYLKLTELNNKIIAQDNYNNKTEQLLELNTVDNKLLNNDIINVKNAVKINIEQIGYLESSFANLAATRKDPDAKIKMLSIENLINMASTKLKLEYDLKTAVIILKLADEYLKNETQPDLINLRKQILNKINLLEQVKLPDLVKVIADLEQFITRIDEITILDLMQNQLTPNLKMDNFATQNNPENSHDTHWWQILNNLKTDLFNLIRIRKIDDKDSAKIIKLLDDQQINILKLYFKLKATQAIIGIRQHDTVALTTALADLDKNINFYFVNNEQLRVSLLALIDSNKDIDLIPQFPDVSDLYQAIKIAKVN
jgi:uncharacterized protein HemX